VADSSVAKNDRVVIEQKLGTAELLFQRAQEMGLQPNWIVPNGLFAVSANGRETYINFARSPLNSHTSESLAKNKYAARLIMGRHNLPNIPFAQPQTHADAALFLSRHGKIIAKPTHGAGARDINIVTDPAQLEALEITNYILEKYVAGQEFRYLVLNDTVIGMYRSDYGTSVDSMRPLQCISYPEAAWNSTLISLSVQAVRVLGLTFAAVDYLVDASGRAYILEINATPDLKWFHAPTSGPAVDVARQFLEAIFEENPEKMVPASAAPALGTYPTLAYS
jgi:glutathione synthase/RimK-type ligase-like ATP-grasp enzyme